MPGRHDSIACRDEQERVLTTCQRDSYAGVVPSYRQNRITPMVRAIRSTHHGTCNLRRDLAANVPLQGCRKACVEAT
jgi:hypothetical protein